MKKVSLRPYPGSVWLCQSRDEFRAAHKKLTKLDFTAEIYGGVEELIESPKEGFVFLVFADSNESLVHELGHVLLDLFTQVIFSEPAAGNGEPFCYMFETLFQELAGFEDDTGN